MSATAPGIDADELEFAAVDRGAPILLGGGSVSPVLLQPLRRAVEATVQPPFRAHARRSDGDSWVVEARPARVERFTAEGDELELTHDGGRSTLRVDGVERPGTVARLEVIGLTLGGASFVARATRLRGDQWEVRVARSGTDTLDG